jgi:hypothetical protein
MNIGKISAVTIASPDLSKSVEQYVNFLNYRLVDEGQVSKEEAIAWKAENIQGADYIVLQPENSNDFAFRFIKQESQGEYIPFKSGGWNAAELIVRNVDEMAIRLSNSEFEIIGPPADLSFTDQIRAMQIVGPSSEILYLTEFKSKLPEFDSPTARCDVDQTFIVILAGSSMDKMQEFYCGSFNLEKAPVMDSRIRAISRVFGNPEDTKYKSAAIPIKDQCLIEIDELPDGSTIRSSEPGYLLPGISMVSFLAYDNLFSDSSNYDCSLIHLKGKKCSIVHGNEQEIIELVHK